MKIIILLSFLLLISCSSEPYFSMDCQKVIQVKLLNQTIYVNNTIEINNSIEKIIYKYKNNTIEKIIYRNIYNSSYEESVIIPQCSNLSYNNQTMTIPKNTFISMKCNLYQLRDKTNKFFNSTQRQSSLSNQLNNCTNTLEELNNSK